jgi:hypothetical protein
MPGKLELQRRVMEAYPDVLYSFTSFVSVRQGEPNREGILVNPGAAFGAWKETNGPGVPYSSVAELPEDLPRDLGDFKVYFGNEYESLMRADYMVGGLLVVRREAAGENLRYPEDVQFCKDWECQARLARVGSAAYLDRDLYRWFEHPGLRYADLETLEKATSRLTILGRIWGRDQAFLSEHGDELRERIDEQRALRAQALLRHGETEAARRELRLLGPGAPLSHRVLAMLPGPVVKAGVEARRFLRGLVNHRRLGSWPPR